MSGLETHASFQPKRFYRELDRLLGEVEHGGFYAQWFPWIVSEIVARLGPALSIEGGRLFEEHGGEFMAAAVPGALATTLAADEPPVRLVRTHGVHLFDGRAAGSPPPR